jgi:ATP adenylyltransferase
VPRHFLLVTRGGYSGETIIAPKSALDITLSFFVLLEFQPQTIPPSPDSLAIAYRILQAHKSKAVSSSSYVGKGKELLAFYNCGKVSGASQPHQHIQFAEMGGEDGVKTHGSDSDVPQCAIPTETLLDRIPRDGSEEGEIVPFKCSSAYRS